MPLGYLQLDRQASVLQNGLALARACNLAYRNRASISAELVSHGFGFHRFIEAENAFAIYARADDSIETLIAVRGTDEPLDWVHNIRIGQIKYKQGRVHAGFFDHASQLWKELHSLIEPNDRIWLTGHSLGGAAATLLADFIQRQQLTEVRSVMTFGAPRVFDPTAAAHYRPRLVRFCNVGDLVPHLPSRGIRLRYNHPAGRVLHLNSAGKVQTERSLWLVRAITSLAARFLWKKAVSNSSSFGHSISEYVFRLRQAMEREQQS